MLTLSELQTQVKDFVPNKDADSIMRAGNFALRELFRKMAPLRRTTLTTTAPKTAGTLTVTQGSAAVVGLGTDFQTTDVDAMIKIQGEDTWFSIATRTDTLNITLSSAWAQANGAGLTYQVVYPFVALPSGVQDVKRVWRTGRADLVYAGDERSSEVESLIMSPGEPTMFCDAIESVATTGVRRIQLVRPPDAAYVFNLSYRVRPTLMTAAGSTSGLPETWDDAFFALTMVYVWDQEDKQDRSAFWVRKARDAVSDVMAHANTAAWFDRADPAVPTVPQFSHVSPIVGS